VPNNILITPGSASIQFSGSASSTIRLQVENSGSIAFYGNSGSLFGITDSLSGSLMSVNDVSGLPILEVFSDDRVVMGTFNRNTLVVTGSEVNVNGVFRNRLNLSTQTTNYTLALQDEGKLIFMASGGANIVTVPLNSTVNFPIGTQIMITQSGSGQTSFTSASTGVTLFSANNAVKIANRYSAATLIKNDTNAWYLFGDITV
jgi:hypothetical protein